jgi:RNA polymerase sigma-70 factor (ECF subfamily)
MVNDQYLKENFEKIYEENFERLIRYAFSITKDKEIAEDVVADVFANLWDKRDQLNNIKELRYYLNASIRNQAIKTIKKNIKLPFLATKNESYDHITLSDNTDPENLLMGKELGNMIASVINSLPPQAGKIYNLSKNGKSNQQIALDLEISKRTVENHLYSVFKKFKEELKKYYET